MGNETNISCDEVGLSPEQIEYIKTCGWWIEKGVNLPASIMGVFLNFLALIVLACPSMRSNFFNRLLFVLATFDIIYLSCEISEAFRHPYQSYGHQHTFVLFIYPVRSVTMCLSILMTIVLTFERYQAITNPAQYRMRDSENIMKRLCYYIIPLFTITCIYYIPKFLDFNVDEVIKCMNGTSATYTPIREEVNPNASQYVNCTIIYPLIPTEMRINHHYILWYINISNLLLTAIMPVTVLLYLNCRIYSSLSSFMERQPSQQSTAGNSNHKRHQANDYKKTIILFSIVIMFILGHTLRIVLNIRELLNLTKTKETHQSGCNDTKKYWGRILIPINQLMIIISSSSNFFIYSFFDPAFRQVLRKVCTMQCLVQRPGQINDSRREVRERRLEAASEMNPNKDFELSNINKSGNKDCN